MYTFPTVYRRPVTAQQLKYHFLPILLFSPHNSRARTSIMGNASSLERNSQTREDGRSDLAVENTRENRRKRKFEDALATEINNDRTEETSWSSPPNKVARAAAAFKDWSFQEAIELVAPRSSQQYLVNVARKRNEKVKKKEHKNGAVGDNLVGKTFTAFFTLPRFHRESAQDGKPRRIPDIWSSMTHNYARRSVGIRKSTVMQPQEHCVAVCANVSQQLKDAQRCPFCESTDLVRHKSSCPLSFEYKRRKIGNQMWGVMEKEAPKLSNRHCRQFRGAATRPSRQSLAEDSTKKGRKSQRVENMSYEFIRSILESKTGKMKCNVYNTGAPAPVEILIDYMLQQCPLRCGGPATVHDDSKNKQRLEWFRSNFSDRKFLFKCPKQIFSKNSSPSRQYTLLSGTKISLVCWELQDGCELSIDCPLCNQKMTCDRFEKLTPMFNTTGKPIFVASMIYRCLSCYFEESGCSPGFICRLPVSLQKSFLCPANWIKPGLGFFVTYGLANKIEEVMKNNPQNGSICVEGFLNTISAGTYAMESSSYLVACGGTPKEEFPSFKEWFGEVEIPKAVQIELLYKYATGQR